MFVEKITEKADSEELMEINMSEETVMLQNRAILSLY